eukprot:TRINITY_DN12889_c1_g1_i2.p1 TRINITY_DN12889_c1_g1~~TRINITY_DN12889_c1_g1_i2.p1  ORF type:complete len:815 (-),score=101.76 TRINITY_DN12889_c1_g1_i2:27-2471(-)
MRFVQVATALALHALLFGQCPADAQGGVLVVVLHDADGQPHVKAEGEASVANWNQAIDDSKSTAFAGTVTFDEKNPSGCAAFDASQVGGQIVLIDSADACEDLPLIVRRAAEAGAEGLVAFSREDGPVGIALGNHAPPSIRAVGVGRAQGETMANAVRSGRTVSVTLTAGIVIAEDAYEEQFIFRADEVASTRAVNFVWHTYPSMLTRPQQEPLSLKLMRFAGFAAPDGWFSRPPDFVPLFNPSLVSLDDGSLIVTLRMSNGPGCPSLRQMKETSMETRRFHNSLVLAHVDGQTHDVKSYVFVELPPLTAHFTNNTTTGGRQFLDEVSGAMDARITAGAGGDVWLTFYAEHNLEASNEVFRGMHAALLHVAWQPCSNAPHDLEDQHGPPAWKVRDGAVVSPGCKFLAVANATASQNEDSCRAACDEDPLSCNAFNFKAGHCVLRHCLAAAADTTTELAGWRTGLRQAFPRAWSKATESCDYVQWLDRSAVTDLSACRQACEGNAHCNAVQYSERHSACILQRCGASSVRREVRADWEAWHLRQTSKKSTGPPRSPESRCLARAWVEPTELIPFPIVSGGVEKNWNILRAGADSLVIEYHVEPHITLQAGLLRRPATEDEKPLMVLSSFSHYHVSRWPSSVLHGISNVRGGFCCLALPRHLWQDHLQHDGLDDSVDEILLGAGHLQRIRSPYDQAPGDVSRFRRQARSRAYHQFFYALRPSEPFDHVAVSPEWCITLGGHFSEAWRSRLSDGEQACEAIQFASGLALRGNDTLVVGYGINDCEADLLNLPLRDVLAMLRPMDSVVNVSIDELEFT